MVRGYNQEEGIDFEESFAPVARMEAIRIFVAYAAHRCFSLSSNGCEDGFSQWTIERRVYVEQPEGFVDPDHPNHVYKLKKLYMV